MHVISQSSCSSEQATYVLDSAWAATLLNALGDPLVVLDERRNIVYRNLAAERVFAARSGFCVSNNKLIATTGKGQRQLDQLLSPVVDRAAMGTWAGYRVSRAPGQRDWLLLLMHLQQSGAASMVCIRLIARHGPRTVPIRAMVELFDLSERELQVVREFLRNRSPKVIGHKLGISKETVRSHFKRIFRKCNVGSQSELHAILQSISLFAQDR